MRLALDEETGEVAPPFLGQDYTVVSGPRPVQPVSLTRQLSRWAVNRDRPCPGGGVVSNCSGIDQSNWQFTSITAGFTG